MDYLKLTSSKLDPSEISELVAHETCGAVAMFAGTTRDNFEGKQVVSLQYEAYDEMAKKEMASICYEVRQRWPDVRNIAMYHRLGLVPVKEASVVIAISSPHRKSALDALPFALDELKKSVPVWKKEFYKEIADDDKNEQRALQKRKRENLRFEDCEIIDELQLPGSLVQIVVEEKEMHDRIKSFIELKREEINRNNLIDFIDGSADESCARVASNVYKVKDSKGHLKIKRVKNETGPKAYEKFEDFGNEKKFSGIDERLENAENFLQIKASPVSKDIYKRLKIVEDRIAHLNTISPEYSRLVASKATSSASKPIYTIRDLDNIIGSIERRESEIY